MTAECREGTGGSTGQVGGNGSEKSRRHPDANGWHDGASETHFDLRSLPGRKFLRYPADFSASESRVSQRNPAGWLITSQSPQTPQPAGFHSLKCRAAGVDDALTDSRVVQPSEWPGHPLWKACRAPSRRANTAAAVSSLACARESETRGRRERSAAPAAAPPPR